METDKIIFTAFASVLVVIAIVTMFVIILRLKEKEFLKRCQQESVTLENVHFSRADAAYINKNF